MASQRHALPARFEDNFVAVLVVLLRARPQQQRRRFGGRRQRDDCFDNTIFEGLASPEREWTRRLLDGADSFVGRGPTTAEIAPLLARAKQIITRWQLFHVRAEKRIRNGGAESQPRAHRLTGGSLALNK